MPKAKSERSILKAELRLLITMIFTKTCKEAAESNFISPKTAYKHVENACARNNVKSMLAVLIIAILKGYIKVKINEQGKIEVEINETDKDGNVS